MKAKVVLCSVFVVALSVLAEGAHAQLVQHVSAVYPPMTDVLFAAPAPIARELKYTYYHQKVIGGEALPPIVSTNAGTGGATPSALPSLALPAPQTGASMIALYERKEAQARADGNGVMATYYSSLGDNAQQINASFDQVYAAIGLMNAGMALGSALGQVVNDAAVRSAAEWVAQTTGAVGPSAPEGTVLHLGLFESFEAKKLSLESRTDLVVTATLEVDGQHVAQAANTMALLTYRKRNPAAATAQPGFVVLNDALRGIVNETVNARRTNRVPFGPQYAIVGSATVGALYAELADAEQSP